MPHIQTFGDLKDRLSLFNLNAFAINRNIHFPGFLPLIQNS